MSVPTEENMKADTFPRSGKAPPVPPKSPSLRGVYQTPKDPPDTPKTTSAGVYQNNQDNPKSPSLGVNDTPKDPDTSSSPPVSQKGSSARESSVSPAPVRPPPLPRKTKSYIYLHPNNTACSNTSYGRQTSSPGLVSSAESEPRPLGQTESEPRPLGQATSKPPYLPSEPRSSLEPDTTQTQVSASKGSVAGKIPQTSQSPPAPPPAPKTRNIYLTCEDIAPRCSTPDSQTPVETVSAPTASTPILPEQVPGTQDGTPTKTCPSKQEDVQPAEYDTLRSDSQKTTSIATPPPVPPKTKTRPRPQPAAMTMGGYDNKLLYSKNRVQWEAYQIPRPDCPAPEAYADGDVHYMNPSSSPRESYIQMAGTASPPAPSKKKPALSLTRQSAIYEAVIQELPTTRGEKVSPNPLHPQPPPFSPPPPPTPSPRGSTQEPWRIPHYVGVLPHLPGPQGGTLCQSQTSLGTLSRSASESHPDIDAALTLPRSLVQGDGEASCRLSKMLKTMESFSLYSSRYATTAEEKTQRFNQMANQTNMVLKCFQSMLLTRADTLRSYISELNGIADNLEKISQRHKVTGITGGTASAAGGVAAVVGIALAPLTMGASLIATAVGAGVAVAAGGVGAGSAIKKKKMKSTDHKRVEEIIKAYKDQVGDLDKSLEMVRAGMEGLRVQNLTAASDEALWMAHVAQAAYELSEAGSAKPAPLSAVDILKGFDAGAEVYSNNEGPKLKKGSEKKFGTKVRTLAQQLQEALKDMTHAHEIFTLATASV